jgi:hypothetical protein
VHFTLAHQREIAKAFAARQGIIWTAAKAERLAALECHGYGIF